MKERIRQLADGRVDIELPEVVLYQPKIEETIACGQNSRGDIRIGSGNQLAFRGLIYSDDSRVALMQESFGGVNVYIPYEVQAEKLEAGTVLKGRFSLVTNGGEFEIPYCFHIKKQAETAGEAASSPEELAELARRDPAAADAFLEDRRFEDSPLLEDKSVRAVYDGLRRAVNRRNLTEQFLIAVGAKRRVVLSLETEKMELDVSVADVSGELALRRSGWGRTEIRIHPDHPAVTVEKERLTDQDFNGEVLEIPFTVNRERLHAGRNWCRIRVETAEQSLACELTMTKSVLTGGVQEKRERRKERVEFIKAWLNVLAGKGDRKENLDFLQYVWEEMTKDTPELGLREKLLRAAISLARGDRELAGMILEDAGGEAQARRRENVDAFCAYQYLDMRLTESWEKKEQLLKLLQYYKDEGKETVFLYYLKLMLDEGVWERPTDVSETLRGFWQKGSSSPFLYLQMCRLYNRYPDILKSPDLPEFQALSFGARHGYLGEKTALHVAALAGQTRGRHPEYVRILTDLYETYPRDEVLTGLCAVMIREGRKDAEAFAWYEKGVERDIRLTRLYDIYLAAVPEDFDRPFPREIVLYFSYNSPREPESQKKLYLNVLRHYGQDQGILDSYEGQMMDFVRAEIRAGKMDAGLASLYGKMLTPEAVDEKLAKALPDILCTQEITAPSAKFTEAVIVYGELGEELTVPVRAGRAYAPMYSESCRVLFADAAGNRYAGTDAKLRLVMEHTDALWERCRMLCPRHPMMNLAEGARIAAKSGPLTDDEVRFLKRYMDVRDLHRQYRAELMSVVAECVIRQKRPTEEDVFACVRYPGVSREQRLQLIRILIRQGQMSEAARQCRRVGYRDLPKPDLLRFVSLRIQNGLYERDEQLLDMCFYLFRKGQCDDIILEYLCMHYNSASADMAAVLKTASSRDVAVGDMAERLLAQMLFSGTYEGMDEVFSVYLNQGNADRLVIQAYFVVKCTAYFVHGQATEESVFHFARHLVEKNRENEIPLVCLLALAKYFSEKSSLDEEEQAECRTLVAGLYRRGMIFPWMKKFTEKIPLPEDLRYREWIEYRGEPNRRLLIAARILPEEDGRPALCREMPEIYPGIYVRSFLLFDGEELEYEIIREQDGKNERLERGSRRGTACGTDDESRFACLNRLQAETNDEKRVEDWQQDALDYAMQEAWCEELFPLPDEKK